MPQSNAAGCVNVAKALEQLGVQGSKIVSNPLCLSGDVAAGLGGDLATWVYGIASTLAVDKTDKAAVPFDKALAQLKQPKLAADAWVIVAWGQILTTVKMMNQIGVVEAHVGEVHDHDPRVQGPAGPRRAEPALRQVQDRARRVQRPGAVLPVPWARASSSASPAGCGRRATSRRRASKNASSSGGAATAAPRFPVSRDAWTGQQLLLFAILGLGSGSLIAGIALGVVLTYRGSGIINLATGAVAMVAGYSYWSLKTGVYGCDVPTAAALLVTLVVLARARAS